MGSPVNDQVYVAWPQDGYQWLLADKDADYEQLHGIASHRPGEEWRPPPMHLLERLDDGSILQPADLPWLEAMTMAVAGDAMERIRPLLEPYGEFLPVSGAAADCQLFNCTIWTDALDEGHSEITRYSDGRIMWVEALVFSVNPFEQAEVVRLSQTPRGPIYYAESLVERMSALELTGTVFKACD